MRVGLLLIRPVFRAIDWAPLLVASVLALSLPLIMTPTLNVASLVLRLASFLLGAAAAFTLVDPMAGTVAATSTPRPLRQWLRTIAASCVAALAWTTALQITAARVPSLPLTGLTVEAAVTVSVGLAAASLAVRQRPGRSAAFSGVVVQLTAAAISVIALRYNHPWPSIGESRWAQVHRDWLWALPAPLLLLAVGNADPILAIGPLRTVSRYAVLGRIFFRRHQ